MKTIYHGFLPQHTASTHRVFAIVDHGGGETMEALATFPTAERADTVADLLNLLTVGHPPERTRDRLLAALDAEPGPVRAAVTSILDALDTNPHALAVHLRRRATAGFASFPVTGCPTGGCDTSMTCADGCLDCAACDSGECDTCMPPVITPRTALLLHTAAEILSDEVTAALENPDGWEAFPPFFRHLPPAAVERFRTAFLDLAADLTHGAEPHPRTNAEEMALHLMTDRATAELELGAFDKDLEQLPETTADYDWEGILDTLFQDSDYTMLMTNPGKLHAKTIASLFHPFDDMPERPYTTSF
ncbi:hypothetical protein [Micromonospora sagamiensis]|uniref:Uncharacterized protein n=1 Tax=Micromonospora sagamiensis TaxID=47875 RepID=A0A562WQ36_9ACTN|nr:hypothetical protein [Micromonospora sagamiensis]TWJ32328.1 hypothetical protein JD81_05903 [Micromonospora sagamiensis]BCL14606.1 hypothetical protein GCM10017556_23450 [Micromonospora sagamiensis]